MSWNALAAPAAGRYALPWLLLLGSEALASENATPSSIGMLFQVLLSLAIVLGLLALGAWGLKRFSSGYSQQHAVAKIVGGVSVGNRERVVVVEVADQWIVVGVAPGQVRGIATLPIKAGFMPDTAQAASIHATAAPAKTFGSWLKQTLDKSSGR
ncbi:MAG: flagellar biosynthetic protein FliO [Methylophilaceae bacterium]